MTRSGLEELANSREFLTSAAKAVQNPVQFAPEAVQTDDDLARLIEAWPTLTAYARHAVLAIVEQTQR